MANKGRRNHEFEMIPREMVIFFYFSLPFAINTMYSAPINILMSHEILPAVVHDDFSNSLIIH